jgi:hypothetical protein
MGSWRLFKNCPEVWWDGLGGSDQGERKISWGRQARVGFGDHLSEFELSSLCNPEPVHVLYMGPRCSDVCFELQWLN